MPYQMGGGPSGTGPERADRSRCRIEYLSCDSNVGRVEEGPKSVSVVFAPLLCELEIAWTDGLVLGRKWCRSRTVSR